MPEELEEHNLLIEHIQNLANAHRLPPEVTMETEMADAIANHSHPTHGDINFTGTVSADGELGLTRSIPLSAGVLHIKKGLIWKWTPTPP